MTIFGAFFFASIVLTSCGGGVEADAEKMCDMMCDAQELMEKAQKDPTNTDLMGEAMKMTTDNASTMAEMEEKYKDDPEGKKALAEAVLACKCD